MHYLHLYSESVQRALRGIGKSPWTVTLPLLYVVASLFAVVLVMPLGGTLGGFALGIFIDLLASSLLYFVAQAVQSTPARPRELQQSVLAYFWPVVSFGFIYWIASWALSRVLAEQPNGEQIRLAIYGVAAVLLNVVPEVIYQKSPPGGIAIIVESVRFIQKHWIEWLIPNLALLVGLYQLWQLLVGLPYGSYLLPLWGVLLYVGFVVRGCLFGLIDSTSPYQLKMRYRKS